MKRSGAAALAVAAVLASGCATLDRPAMSRFEPDGVGFRFEASTDVVYRDDAAGEATRIGWLETYLRENGMCPHGYVITRRTVTRVTSRTGRIFYRGHCTG